MNAKRVFFTAMIMAAGFAAKGQCTVAPDSPSSTVCVGTALTGITYTTTGATGIADDGVSGTNGLPSGVSATWSSNTITISGTPTDIGTFNYSIPLVGCNPPVNAKGAIIVNPVPKISGNLDTVICTGTAFEVTPTDDGENNVVPVGTTYRWTVPVNSVGATGNVVQQLPSISQTLTNNSDVIQSVTYTVSPRADGCIGATFKFTVIVNPILAITNLSYDGEDTICDGAVPGTMEIEVNILNAKYQWQDSVEGRVWEKVTDGSSGNTAIYSPPALDTTTYYRCNVTSDCGEDTTSGVIPIYVVKCNSITLVSSVAEDKAFIVSPNPISGGSFTVSFNRDLLKEGAGNYLLSVYSVTGAKIWEQRISSFDDITINQLTASGFYTIVLAVGNKQYSREIMVK